MPVGESSVQASAQAITVSSCPLPAAANVSTPPLVADAEKASNSFACVSSGTRAIFCCSKATTTSCWPETAAQDYAAEWQAELAALSATCSFQELMGHSVHPLAEAARA